MVTLIVITPLTIHQFVYTHSVSLSSGGTQNFKLGLSNPNSQAVWAQVTVTVTGSFGDTYTGTTAITKINGGSSNGNNLAISIKLTNAAKGEHFTFAASVLVSAVNSGAVYSAPENQFFGEPFPYVTSAGQNTAAIAATFTVTA